MKTFKLTPADNRKTLTNNLVNDNGNKLELISYNTKVAEYNKENDKLIIFGYYSKTTSRHINAFLKYLNKPLMNKSEILNLVNQEI